MTKWIGGIFGNTIASNATFPFSGVFSSQNQYSMKQEGGWDIPFITATGGTIIDDGGYRIHVFTSPGSFVVSSAPVLNNTVECLVVAGGGGGRDGGGSGGGGGGAGGFLIYPTLPISTGTYPIAVGAGAAGKDYNTPAHVGGSPSTALGLTATGGGDGGAYNPVRDGQPGGSGGGGGSAPPAGSGGTGIAGQGNAGGTGSTGSDPAYAAGGGGGAGAAGQPAVEPNPVRSYGGIGSPITWLPASYGTPGPAPGRYFAGGGGGGIRVRSYPARGIGGAGGGGDGGVREPVTYGGTDGGTNTGGGGGGAVVGPTVGNGGSGIVVIRYPYTP